MAHSLSISGKTRIAAIFGDPVEHSMSPTMHNAAYAALGIDRVYVAYHVDQKSLSAAIRALVALEIVGVNLTVPHKEAAARLLSRLSPEAGTLGAVNCVINRGGELYGDNTDARGLERDLRENRVKLRGQLAIIIGAGGAAASATLACIRMGAREIIVVNRTLSRAVSLIRRFRGVGTAALEARGLGMLTDRAILLRAALVVNATPMGLTTGAFAKVDYQATAAGCFFYDTVYATNPTPFIRPALTLGRRALDGLGMLVNQGELAFRLFNRSAAPAGVMRRAAMEHLGRKDPGR